MSPAREPHLPADPTGASSANVWMLVYIFGLIFIQGLMVNHVSVLLPVLKQSLGLDEQQLGMVSGLAFAGALPALFMSGYVTEFIGPKLSGGVAIVFTGVGCLIMGSATYWTVIAGILILHFGFNWILSVHSAVITTYYPHSRQRLFFLAMAMLAVGAIIGPPAMGKAIEKLGVNSWGKVYIATGLTVWILFGLLCLVCGRHISELGRKKAPSDTRHSAAPLSRLDKVTQFRQMFTSGLFNQPALYLLGVIVILDNLALVNVVSWTGILAEQRFEARTDDIGYLTSLLAIGVLTGRIVMASFFSGRISDRKLLGFAYALSMLFFIAMLFSQTFFLLRISYFMMAFFMSAQSATTYAIGADKFKGRAAAGIPIVDGIGSLGAIAAPLIVGSIAVTIGLDQALWLVPIFGFMLTFVCLAWEWVDKHSAPHSTHQLPNEPGASA